MKFLPKSHSNNKNPARFIYDIFLSNNEVLRSQITNLSEELIKKVKEKKFSEAYKVVNKIQKIIKSEENSHQGQIDLMSEGDLTD